MAGTRSATLGPSARPVAVPADLDEGPKAEGVVRLPSHIRWSGPDLAYDLDDPSDRARVYEQVLREGTEDDVRFFVRPDRLLEHWGTIVLPAYVRVAWGESIGRLRLRRQLVLSPLQERVAALVAGMEDASEFALAGGAALIVQGRISRQTRDLDFFGPAPAAVDRLLPLVEAGLAEEGLAVRRVMVDPGFARLEISDGRDQTELDLAADARLLPVQPTTPAPTLSGQELGADKVLAIFSRAEARDFSDLVPLAETYGLDQLLELEGQKDLGFQPKYFAEMLERFDRFRREEFDITDEQFARLKQSVARWHERASERSRERSRDRGDGLDLGF